MGAHAPPGRLLDAGCGDGHYARALAGAGHVVTALDLSPALLTQVGNEVQTVQGSVEALPFPAAHFDAALCLTVLEWVSDPVAALRELRRVLVPGGVLLAGVLGAANGTRALHLERYYSQSPMNGLLPWELHALLTREGYTVTAATGVTRDALLTPLGQPDTRATMTTAMIWLVAAQTSPARTRAD